MLETIRNKPYLFGAITALIAVLNIVCISLPYWMSVHGEDNIGPYQSAQHGSSRLYETNCSYEHMSQTECGYLQALQVSAVVTVLCGAFSAILFSLPPKTFAALPAFVANTGVLAQVVFSIITVVLFHYFQRSYFDDDGVNQEYPAPGQGDVSYDALFYLWIAGTVISFCMASVGFGIINKTSYVRKGLLSGQN